MDGIRILGLGCVDPVVLRLSGFRAFGSDGLEFRDSGCA